jgi:hypothetical protein
MSEEFALKMGRYYISQTSTPCTVTAALLAGLIPGRFFREPPG